MIKNLFLILTITLAIAGSAVAQSPKAAEQQKTKKPVDGNFSVLRSHIKSVGTIGKTGRYQIVSARIRGLDSPNISALLAYDSETDQLAVLASGVEPGLGVAIVNGGASVGSSYLFGSKIRPTRINENVSNNSQSEGSSADGGNSVSVSEGGDANSVSKSSGGAGGNAVSISDADAKSSSSSASSVKNSNSNRNSSVNSNRNSNNQSQGQIQGQQQSQTAPKATKPAPCPKKSVKSVKSKKSKKSKH